MPRGKWTGHKGRNRYFTNPEALEEERRRDEEKKKARERRRANKDDDDSTSESEEEASKGGRGDSSGSEDSESESESDEEERKGKGVEKLIEISNPNRVKQKAKKLSTLNETLANSEKPELSRREREELERQAAMERHQKLHAEGRTEEARADLARLAIIKQQREEAAQRRKQEQLKKEEQMKSKQQAIGRALGKKS